jgi:hypothetical protein
VVVVVVVVWWWRRWRRRQWPLPPLALAALTPHPPRPRLPLPRPHGRSAARDARRSNTTHYSALTSYLLLGSSTEPVGNTQHAARHALPAAATTCCCCYTAVLLLLRASVGRGVGGGLLYPGGLHHRTPRAGQHPAPGTQHPAPQHQK